MANMVAIIIAVIGSSGLAKLIEYWCTKPKREYERMEYERKQAEKHDEIIKQLLKHEKDIVRTQLLLLLTSMPESTDEIMKVGQHYFEDLHGNWFATDLFNDWLESEHRNKPSWFKG